MTSTSFRNGIIAQSESAHLQRITNHRRWWARAGGWLLKVTAAFWAVFLAYAAVLALQHPSGHQLPRGSLLLLGIVGFLTTIIHFIVVYRMSVVASESVMRERRGRTWETLVMTVIDARHLVLGKWWASMRIMWREFALLSLMRAGGMVGVGIFLYLRMLYGLSVVSPVVPGLGKLILSVCLIAIFTLLNMAFTAAAGVLGGLVTSRSEGVAVPMAQSIRMTAVLVPIITLLAVGIYLAYAPSGPHMNLDYFETGALVTVALLDNGVFAAAAVASSHDPGVVVSLVIAIAAMIVYAALTLVLLAAAQYLAQRQGILPPETKILAR